MSAARLTFAELTIGRSETIEVSVRAEDIDRFAALSGDHAPVHTDAAHAAAAGFAGRVMHGAHLAALVSQLVGMKLPGAFGVLQSMELEFRRPVTPPASLAIRGEVIARSEAVRQVTIRIEVRANDEVAATGRVKSVVREPAS